MPSKFCKDCFYCQTCSLTGVALEPMFWRCSQSYAESPLDGKKDMAFCMVERSWNLQSSVCGTEGKLFADRKERESEINRDGFPKNVDEHGDWIV